ncbi:MAG TPA: hypothetical protein VJ276_25755 [Thermoanaerobaculia bacterium]|nr:hypothetical protein [Thermoanaerobaculia bacterium]
MEVLQHLRSTRQALVVSSMCHGDRGAEEQRRDLARPPAQPLQARGELRRVARRVETLLRLGALSPSITRDSNIAHWKSSSIQRRFAACAVRPRPAVDGSAGATVTLPSSARHPA